MVQTFDAAAAQTAVDCSRWSENIASWAVFHFSQVWTMYCQILHSVQSIVRHIIYLTFICINEIISHWNRSWIFGRSYPKHDRSKNLKNQSYRNESFNVWKMYFEICDCYPNHDGRYYVDYYERSNWRPKIDSKLNSASTAEDLVPFPKLIFEHILIYRLVLNLLCFG